MTDSLMRLHIATGDPDEAHDWLRTAYVDHSAKLSGRRRNFHFSHRMADCGVFTVGVARHTMALNGEWDPLDNTLLFSHLLAGRFTIRSNHHEIDAGPGDVFSYDPDAQMVVEWSDIRMSQIRMSRGAVDRIAAELVGDDREAGSVAFDLARPRTAAKALRWKHLMQYAAGDVAVNPAVHGSPLVLQQVFRLIVATALETFPNATMGNDRHPGAGIAPAVIRRAVAFIEERAADAIDLTAIADAAHVGPRALQRAFRSALDTTPLGYLRAVRLQRAHDDLRVADPTDGTTVAGVAARWGFGNPGRFAAEYRSRFGRSPYDTLRG